MSKDDRKADNNIPEIYIYEAYLTLKSHNATIIIPSEGESVIESIYRGFKESCSLYMLGEKQDI